MHRAVIFHDTIGYGLYYWGSIEDVKRGIRHRLLDFLGFFLASTLLFLPTDLLFLPTDLLFLTTDFFFFVPAVVDFLGRDDTILFFFPLAAEPPENK